MNDARLRAEAAFTNWKTDNGPRAVNIVDYIEAAIVLAVQAEREACANVAMQYSAEYHGERANHNADDVKAMLKQAVTASKNIANAIRSQ